MMKILDGIGRAHLTPAWQAMSDGFSMCYLWWYCYFKGPAYGCQSCSNCKSYIKQQTCSIIVQGSSVFIVDLQAQTIHSLQLCLTRAQDVVGLLHSELFWADVSQQGHF